MTIQVLVGYITAIAVAGTVAAMANRKTNQTDYWKKLFSQSLIHKIDFEIDIADLERMKMEPDCAEGYHANLTIDGDFMKNISLSAETAGSLQKSSMKDPFNDYCLKITFNKYNKHLTYFGLDSMHLYHVTANASEMKDFVAFSMFREMGIPAPLCTYVRVTVNSQSCGLFLAVEDIGEGFLERNFSGEGHIYKIDIASPVTYGEKYANHVLSDFSCHAITDADAKDIERLHNVIAILSGENTETSLFNSETPDFLNQLITYFVVHNFTGKVAGSIENAKEGLYLYENKGELQVIPWNYHNRTTMITDEKAQTIPGLNFFPVDTEIDDSLLFSTTTDPMWGWILENAEALAQYYDTFDQFLVKELESGRVTEIIDKTNLMMEADMSADNLTPYVLEQHQHAITELMNFVHLRTGSIRGQLTERKSNDRNSCESDNQSFLL